MSVVALAVLFAFSDNALVDRFIIHQTMPGYNMRDAMQSMLRFIDVEPFVGANDGSGGSGHAVPVGGRLVQLEDVDITDGVRVLGLEDVIFQYESESYLGVDGHFAGTFYTVDDIAMFRNFERLRNNFYTVDGRTGMMPDLFCVDAFMEHDLRIAPGGSEPRVLIFHTHLSETFVDSRNITEGVMAVGARLAQVLEQRHGIVALHVTERFDGVRAESYEVMEPRIRQILAENPSIEVIIDLHRDGVPEHRRLVTDINGRPTAQ
ncbi:MAG: stage II sporulation protein P, partial [Defluviitaleaceae bacterium]|nr:stage II sporulation protein P [Defluviitaleaceae bacterium]